MPIFEISACQWACFDAVCARAGPVSCISKGVTRSRGSLRIAIPEIDALLVRLNSSSASSMFFFTTLQRFFVSILSLRSCQRWSAASQSSGRRRRLRRGALLAHCALNPCVCQRVEHQDQLRARTGELGQLLLCSVCPWLMEAEWSGMKVTRLQAEFARDLCSGTASQG